MNDDTLSALLCAALTTTDDDAARLHADFARRRAQESEVFWKVHADVQRLSMARVHRVVTDSLARAFPPPRTVRPAQTRP
jgi:hypothetical protein